MKKRILTALLASAMILSVAGCDSTTDTGAGDTTTTTAAQGGDAADTTTAAADAGDAGDAGDAAAEEGKVSQHLLLEHRIPGSLRKVCC